MKKIYLFLLLAACWQSATAQFGQAPRGTGAINLGPTLFISDVQGIRKYEEFNRLEIRGTPFFKDQWTASTIRLNDKRQYGEVRLRINLYDNAIHYLTPPGEELVVPDGKVAEVILPDTISGVRYEHVFRTGYPSIDDNSPVTLYEVRTDGKVQLLRLTKKKLTQYQGVGMSTGEKEFVSVDLYYVFRDGQLNQLKRDKEFILNLLSDKREAVSAFIQTNRFRCKSFSEIQLIIAHYNSLN